MRKVRITTVIILSAFTIILLSFSTIFTIWYFKSPLTKTVDIEPSDIHWEQTGGPTGGDFRVIAMNPDNNLELITGNSKNLYKTTDGGKNWDMLDGFLGGYVTEITYDRKNTEVIYVSMSEKGVFKSYDGGVTWNEKNDGIENRLIWVMESCTEDSDIL